VVGEKRGRCHPDQPASRDHNRGVHSVLFPQCHGTSIPHAGPRWCLAAGCPVQPRRSTVLTHTIQEAAMSTTADDRNWPDRPAAHMAAQNAGTELPR
jgi:hypothetical protein